MAAADISTTSKEIVMPNTPIDQSKSSNLLKGYNQAKKTAGNPNNPNDPSYEKNRPFAGQK